MTATDLLYGIKDAIGWVSGEGKQKSACWTGSEVMFLRPRLRSKEERASLPTPVDNHRTDR
jgi:hypothetical protein